MKSIDLENLNSYNDFRKTKPLIAITKHPIAGEILVAPSQTYANNKIMIEKKDDDAVGTIYRTSYQFMDSLGRVIQTQSESENSGQVIFTHTAYDFLGQVMFSDAPQELPGTLGTYSVPNWNNIPHNENTPDELGRVIQVKYPDATTDAFSYSGLRTTMIDRNGHQKIQEKDAFGRLIKVEEYIGSSNPYTLYATTNYAYDPRDLLTNVTDAAANPTTIFYDDFGRKIRMIDPDLGDWRYRYDVFSNVTAQIDARNRALNMYYDPLNRLKGTFVTGNVDPNTYQPPADPDYSGYSNKHYYDIGANAKGHRTSMSNSSATISWTYNALGQATNETHTIDNITYPIIETTFDWMNRPLTHKIPRSQASTETLTYDYTVMQLLSSLKGTGNYAYVSQVHHDATGQVKDQLFGNGLLQQTCYDANRRKTVLRVFPNPGSIPACEDSPANLRLNLLYTYRSNGNVSQVLDNVRNETLNYTYDALDRLMSVNGSYNGTFTYNEIGNLMGKDTGVTYTNPGATGLAAWWTMDEKSGPRQDSHVNNYDLTDNNTVGYDDSAVQGRAASFVAASQERLTVLDNANLSGGNISFTLIAHVYLNNNINTFVILDKSDNASVYDYRIAHNPGTGFRFRVGSGTAYVDSGPVSANAWHTVIAWHDEANDKIYIQVDNGVPNTVSHLSGTSDSTNPLSIGALPGGSTGLDGRIDEVAIYRNRVLTDSERAWIYNVGVRRTYADLTAPPAGPAITYTYDPLAQHIHAVTALNTGESYGYDANGNMICRVEGGNTYKQAYDTENRLTAVYKMSGTCASGTVVETTTFAYDPDGNLVMKINPNGTKTIYVGGVYEEDKNASGTVIDRKTYYPAAGAMRVNPPINGKDLFYVLKDHLGSASILTDDSGLPVTDADVRYFPFGDARPSNSNLGTAPMLTDKLFTGQRDIGLGIYHYGARFYSPTLGRFLSADTIVPSYANPQSLNRYSYVTNNPLRYSDPTGHRACDDVDEFGGCITAPGGGGMGFGGSPRLDSLDVDVDLQIPEPQGVIPESALNQLGIFCGENVDPLACEVYTNTNSFFYTVTVDYANSTIGNTLASISCVLVGQGCIYEGSQYLFDPRLSYSTIGRINWDRYVIDPVANTTAPLFRASWGVNAAGTAEAEIFPLGSSYHSTTVVLKPSAINRAIVWNSQSISVGNLSVGTQPHITFTTQQISSTSIISTGSIDIGGRTLGTITVVGVRFPFP